MIGRAGRPQYDDQGVAVVLVHDVKKGFYKKFLYEPFPVESSLLSVLPDHLNAEVVAGTITSRQDAVDYMTWTYFFRRLVQNPSYYGMEGIKDEDLNSFLTSTVGKCLDELELSYCIETDDDGRGLYSTVLGRISSYYYLAHQTVQHFQDNLTPEMETKDALQVLVDSTEFSQIPVRHNEEFLNADLAKTCPMQVNAYTMDSPHTKAHLLLQSHMSRLPLPCSDYLTDTKSVLDNALRVMQAMIDVCAENGWLASTLRVITLLPMVVQARWETDNSFLVLPHIELHMVYLFSQLKVSCIPELIYTVNGNYERLASVLRAELDEQEIEDVWSALGRMPILDVGISVHGKSVPRTERSGKSNEWIKVQTGSQVSIDLVLRRVNKPGREGVKVIAPRFSKPKDEGWILVLGYLEKKELCALKRVGAVRGTTRQSLVITPERPGKKIYTLYVMSDAYLGLDQQYDIMVEAEGDSDIFYSDDEEMPVLNPNSGLDQEKDRIVEKFADVQYVPTPDWNEDEDTVASWE